jgi:CheY-like chemotaxis protein
MSADSAIPNPARALSATVLLVDDDDALTPLLKWALEKISSGARLEQVSSGEEAVRYLCREGDFGDAQRFPFPSVVLLDLRMPHRDGFWVLNWKRNQPELKSLPVAVWSVSNNPEDKEKAIALGAVNYFEKPMDVEEFSKIGEALVRFSNATTARNGNGK